MTEIVSILIAALSALAAVGSFLAARAANATSKRLATIETERRFEELTPQFEARATVLSNGQVRLTIKLTGPSILDRLDALAVTIRNDSVDHHAAGRFGDLTSAEIEKQVWSRFRLVPFVDGSDQDGRTSGTVSLGMGDDRAFLLEDTPAPRWSTPDDWKRMFQRVPLRISISAGRTGERPWSVPLEPEVIWPIQIG